MSDKYILDEKGNPIKVGLMQWAMWFEKANRSVADQTIGAARVSTVFLGLDHKHTDDGQPVLWETMVFGGALDQEQDRCSGSREQAEAMHAKMGERVRQRQTP